MRKGMKQYVAAHWRRSTLFPQGDMVGITPEDTAVRIITQVTDAMERVVRSKGTLFEQAFNTRRQWIHIEPAGKDLISCLGEDIYLVRRVFPRHRLSPFFELLEELVDRGVRAEELRYETVWYFNNVVEQLRASSRAKKFIAALKKLDRMVKLNSRSLLRHLNRMFDKKGRCLIMRINFHYQRPGAGGFPGTPAYVTDEMVRKHVQALLLYLRRNYPSLVTYVWVIEDGLLRGLHIHLLVAMDADRVRQDIVIARAIGERWANKITKGLGWYHSCNDNKAFYARRGILALGVVHRNNLPKRDNLEKTLNYFAKRDYYVRLARPGIKRVIGKGQLKAGKSRVPIPRRWVPPPRQRKRGSPRAEIPTELTYEELF